MAVTAFVPGVDAPGDVDDKVAVTAAVSATHDILEFRGGDAGSCGRVEDGC